MRHGRTLVAVLLLAGAPGVARGDGPPLPDSRLGVRTAPLLLLSRPDVRKDLALDARQAEAAERAITELYVRAAKLRGQPDEVVVPARQAIDQDQRRWLDEHLTPAQRGRLAQIDLQWEGPAAVVNRPLIAEALGLTPDQRRRLAAAVAQHHDRRDPGADGPRAERPLAEVVLGSLTPDQRNRWKALLGRPFVVQPVTAAARPSSRR